MRKLDRPMIAGLDGCRGGWVLATAPISGPVEIELRVIPDLVELAEDVATGRVVLAGIDMPIGLTESGRRNCDVALRAYLGRRGGSVFPAPIRALIEQPTLPDYRAARELSLASHGKSLSVQSFNLLPKIAAVDALVRTAPNERFVEVHPESAFMAMNASQPLLHGKKTAAGRAERLGLLNQALPPWAEAAPRSLPGAAPDDVLDALAALWSARRWHAGEGLVFGDGERDRVGLPMRIVV